MKISKDYYYNIDTDMIMYPHNWAYIICGGRNTGKTYGTLKSCYLNDRMFTFIKRTMDDVDLICAGGKKNDYFDLSPFKAINRDLDINVEARLIRKGIGGFYDDERLIGYIVALSGVTKFKGFDLSDTEWMIFDEFIPREWERISRQEGEQVLDLYKTIARDREHRGREPLKLVALANATELSNPLFNVLEITDVVAEMDRRNLYITEQQDRGIFIHLLNDNAEFRKQEEKSIIYKAMAGTKWLAMSLENKFAYNDTSNVEKKNMKNFRPLYRFHYKNSWTYVYYNEEKGYYVTKSKAGKKLPSYDLSLDNDYRRFYLEQVLDLQEACINDHVKFDSYMIYDLIMNYKKHFRL